MKFAIVMPARNEAGNVRRVIESIPAGLARQLLVVDNGSTDATADEARLAGAEVVAEPRRGYGQACLTGLAHLDDEIEVVGFLDADGSDDPRQFVNLLEPIRRDEADFVLSARVLGDARRSLTPQQRFGNWLACFLIRLLWGHRYTDLGPLRVIRRDALDRLGMEDRTWGWTVEMQIKALQRRLRVRQIDVPYRPRIGGKSKISGTVTGTIRAGAKILSTIGRLRLCSSQRVSGPGSRGNLRERQPVGNGNRSGP